MTIKLKLSLINNKGIINHIFFSFRRGNESWCDSELSNWEKKLYLAKPMFLNGKQSKL